jgi:SAM-dependent methyltransferase
MDYHDDSQMTKNRTIRTNLPTCIEQVSETYDAIASIYSDKYEAGDPDKVFLDEFLSHVEKGARVLDLGSGTGSGAKYFFDHGMRIEGIDVSGRMVKEAQRHYPEIPFRKADIRNLGHPRKKFDAIWAGYSLFHMGREDFRATLKKIRAAIRDGGIFGLTMQEGKGELQVPEPLVPGKYLLVCLYTRDELEGLLKLNGFEVISYKCRGPASALEYPYTKMLFIARASER